MDVGHDHVIHSRGGRLDLAGTSTIDDVTRLLRQALDAAPPNGLAIHFHGGLVKLSAGMGIAERLAPQYASAGTYPLFFVWESGLAESLKNNLRDVLADAVFQELVKKVAEWALKQLGGAIRTRGSGATINATELRREFDDWFAQRSDTPPVMLGAPADTQYRLRSVAPDEDDLAAKIEAEFDSDERFQEVIAGLYVASGRGAQATTRGGGVAAADVRALVDRQALDAMFTPVAPGSTRGALAWYKVAKFIARVVIAVVHRHLSDRDHGGYATIVEEVLRAAYLDKVGEVVWRMMKKDTADAFAADADAVGTALLSALAALLADGRPLPRITLIGHSTGAIYINHLIEHAATLLPAARFNIVLLAPASRHEDFAALLAARAAAIDGFRMFAMTDDNEAKDELVPVAYLRSLLYFVSGVLEGDADVPIMGMQRFLKHTQTFDQQHFPGVAAVRDWLAAEPNRSVWSIDARSNGFGSAALKHGDFDDDAATIASVRWILQQGY